jgi:hypothetical protein
MNTRILKLASIPVLIAVLLAGCNKESTPSPSGGGSSGGGASGSGASGAGAGGGIVSAEKNSFDQVTAKLDKGGNFYLYLSTEQALGGLSRNIANISNLFSQMPLGPELDSETIARIFEVVDGLAKDSGVEQISGVGASSIAREKDFYYNKLIVHHYEGKADGMIWSAFGKTPHSLKELDLLPEDTAFAVYQDVDVPLAWKTVEAELKKLHIPDLDETLESMPEDFKDAAGISLDDVLASLGGGYGVIFTLDESKQVSLPIGDSPLQIPDPGLAIFFKVKNDAIFNCVDKAMAGNPLVAKMNQNGIKTLSFALPVQLPVSVSPTLARVGDYLILTSSDKLFQDIVATQSGKQAGFKSTAEFKKLSQGIPAEGNNFTVMSEKFGRTLHKVIQGAMSAQGVAMGGAQSKMLQDMMASNISFSYNVGVNGSDGWAAYGNGNKSVGAAIMVIPAVAAVGALSAIAIPNYIQGRNMAQANAGNMRRRGGAPQRSAQDSCIINLRLIDSAKGEWALENNKKNSDTPTEQDLAPYFGAGPTAKFPVCPAGGKYIIGAIGEKPRCTIPGHVLP